MPRRPLARCLHHRASANQIFPDHEITRALHDETARLFEELFLSGKGNTLSRVDSLALYFDFQEFTPIGRRGDEIVRRLADRLVELDLLEQAGALLQHQVDNRLFGAARATVAARLATIRLMDGKPTQALEALRGTRLPELPQAINRARLLLEARALSDLSRTDLALEVVEGESGAEVDRLRADILWNARRWREAGETHEKLVGTRWQGDMVPERPGSQRSHARGHRLFARRRCACPRPPARQIRRQDGRQRRCAHLRASSPSPTASPVPHSARSRAG